MRKFLLIVLAIIIVLIVIIVVLQATGTKLPSITKEKSNEPKINVSELVSDKEKSIGTLVYSAAENVSDVTKDSSNNVVTFVTKDSVDGVINIYNQDLSSRYPTYTISQSQKKKGDAADGSETILTCKGETGKITISAWAGKDGLTNVTITTDSNFK